MLCPLHFELFSCYCELFDNPGSFDVFHSWSSQVLIDFNEIDRYLLPSELVFKNLKDIKEIEAWSFNANELSTGQKKFLEFWETNLFKARQIRPERHRRRTWTSSS